MRKCVQPVAGAGHGRGVGGRRAMVSLLTLFLLLGRPGRAHAYSVLTHEAIVDAAWNVAMLPLLRQRYPGSTPQQLEVAHSYAYGGCVIQDMGYYPFGSKLFTDLVHYVRPGDFVEALLRDAKTLNEYAFALGALSHYVADNIGHSVAVNRAVAMTYPKLERRFGHAVTYEDDEGAHLKTEFGFDVLEVARSRFAPADYRSYIGFQVSNKLLARAFLETYGIPLKSLFTNYSLAVGSYRYSIAHVIPAMTKVAWQLKAAEIQKAVPGITRRRFLFHLSRASYAKYWHGQYRRPGLGSRILAFLIGLLPKVWIFRAFALKMPTAGTEKLFMASFNDALTQYEQRLRAIRTDGVVPLPNDNLDTGAVMAPGAYLLADDAYEALLGRLSSSHFAGVTPQLRTVMLAEFQNLNAPFLLKEKTRPRAALVQEVGALRAWQPLAAPAIAPATAGLRAPPCSPCFE
jgi:hypothetical protein